MKRVLVSNGNPMETAAGFCRAVRVGAYTSVGGTAAVDSAGNTVGVGDCRIDEIESFRDILDVRVSIT